MHDSPRSDTHRPEDGRRVASDDLSPGMLVTILDGYVNRQEIPLNDQMVEVGRVEWYAGIKGEPLKVLSVEIPYCVVLILRYSQTNATTILDTRLCKLIRISPEYAAAARDKSPLRPRKWWRFWRAGR